MGRPTIGLAMIVKDEAENVRACVESALPVIDAWTVIDTGSTDDTPAIVHDALAHLDGELLHRPFDGFGPARTALLEAARDRADYTLMLDADHTLHIEGDRPDLTADSYLIRIRGDMEWRLPLLTRSAHPFVYRGVAHSYLNSDLLVVEEPLDWLSIDGGPGASQEKLEGDRMLLERAFGDDPTDTRTVFYLAQTYRFLGLVDQAIQLYRLRACMGGFEEEVYFARYQLGRLLCEHVAFAQGAPELLQAWLDRPIRVEALRALANAANAVADKTEMPPDNLFVFPDAYKRAEAAA
jgi:glycosyltransferase involved in cell wall biosynthesis